MTNPLDTPEYIKVDGSYPLVEGQEVFYWADYENRIVKGLFCPREVARAAWPNALIGTSQVWAYWETGRETRPTWSRNAYIKANREYKVDQEPMEEEECL